MTITDINIQDIESATPAFLELCHRVRVSRRNINPAFFEELRTAALLLHDMPEYDVIRQLSIQFQEHKSRNIHLQVLFQITSSLPAKILSNPRYGSGKGRRPMLTPSEEQATIDYLRHCQRNCEPKTTTEATQWIN
jgi:hypothetical protein